jgi:hypothetical protein
MLLPFEKSNSFRAHALLFFYSTHVLHVLYIVHTGFPPAENVFFFMAPL